MQEAWKKSRSGICKKLLDAEGSEILLKILLFSIKSIKSTKIRKKSPIRRPYVRVLRNHIAIYFLLFYNDKNCWILEETENDGKDSAFIGRR